MKKTILSISMALALVFSFTACSSDDDNGDSSSNNECKTCDIMSISTEYCDNGDGTITATLLGSSTEIDLEGESFSDYITALVDATGAVCD